MAKLSDKYKKRWNVSHRSSSSTIYRRNIPIKTSSLVLWYCGSCSVHWLNLFLQQSRHFAEYFSGIMHLINTSSKSSRIISVSKLKSTCFLFLLYHCAKKWSYSYKIFSRFIHIYWNKAWGRPVTLLKRILAQLFSRKFYEIFKNSFFMEYLWTATSGFWHLMQVINVCSSSPILFWRQSEKSLNTVTELTLYNNTTKILFNNTDLQIRNQLQIRDSNRDQ